MKKTEPFGFQTRISLLLFLIFHALVSLGQDDLKYTSRLASEKMSSEMEASYKSAVRFFKENDYTSAFTQLNKISNIGPLNLQSLKLKAELFLKLNRYPEVISECYKAIERADMTLGTLGGSSDPSQMDKKKQRIREELTNFKHYCNAMIQTSVTMTSSVSIQDTTQARTQKTEETVGKNEINEIQHPAFEQCKDNIPFEDQDWLPFRINDNDQQKRKYLSDHVTALYKKKYDDAKAKPLNNVKEITCNNLKWLKDNGDARYEWFEELKKKEDLLLQQRMELSNNQRELLKIQGDITSVQSTIDLLKERKKILDADISFQMIVAEKEIWESYYKKMETIPQSIVLIGMTEAPEQVDSLLNKKIDDQLKEAAVELIADNVIKKTSLTLDDKLKSKISLSKSGKARITAQYYTTTKHYLEDRNGQYLFRIVQAEVTPIDTNQRKPDTESSKSDQEITVLKVLSPDSIFESKNPSVRRLKENLKIFDNETEHLRMFCETTKEQNMKYQGKSSEALSQYHNDYRSAKIKMDSLRQQKSKLDSQIYVNQSELKKLQTLQFKQKTADTAILDRLAKYRILYDSVQESMTDYTNKLAVVLSSTTSVADKTLFSQDLVQKCYTAVDEVRQSEITISVSKINTDNRLGKIENERYFVHLKPKATAFKVLSLAQVKNSGSDNETSISLFLNVAFKLRYEVKSKEPRIFDEKALSEPPPSPGVSLVEEVIPNIKPDFSNRTFNDGGTRWLLLPENSSSYLRFIDSGNPDQRLPKMTELRNFFNKLAYNSFPGIDQFRALISFEEDYALFATSEVIPQTELVKCLKISKSNLSILGEENIDIRETANFLIIKL